MALFLGISLFISITLLTILIYLYAEFKKRYKIEMELVRMNEEARIREYEVVKNLLDGRDDVQRKLIHHIKDQVVNTLSSLNMHIDVLQVDSDRIDTLKSITKQVNDELDQISNELISGPLSGFDLKIAIKKLVETFCNDAKLRTKVDISIEGSFPDSLGFQVYCITQELILNSLSHAQCTEIHLELHQYRDRLSMIYEDNGIGFDPDQASGGLGLKSILHRTDQSAGTVQIESSSGKGCSFIFEFVLPEANPPVTLPQG